MLSPVSLPSFAQPPVAEVALAVQFDGKPLRVVDLHVIYRAFADGYPAVEEHPAKPEMMLDGSESGLHFRLLDDGSVMEPPLLWFKSPDGEQIVQVQSDRLVVNWRRRPDRAYPRYEAGVRPKFVDAWLRLESAFQELGHGRITPNVCEVLYVNQIDTSDAWPSFGELDRLVAPWSGKNSDDFLPPPTDVRFALRYDMSPGWLAIEGNPVRRAGVGGGKALILQLTARGPASSSDQVGALSFLDRGREWIVRGFRSVTTQSMHTFWGVDQG